MDRWNDGFALHQNSGSKEARKTGNGKLQNAHAPQIQSIAPQMGKFYQQKQRQII